MSVFTFIRTLFSARRLMKKRLVCHAYYFRQKPELYDWFRRHAKLQWLIKWHIPFAYGLLTCNHSPEYHYVAHWRDRTAAEPNGFFNTANYLSHHPELREKRGNPLWYFYRTGSRLGHDGCGEIRLNLAELPKLRRQCEQRLGIVPIARGKLKAATVPRSGRIAVHLHLFYLEMLPEFASRLGQLKRDHTLLVSVPEGKADAALEHKIRAFFPPPVRVVVSAVPNRGRDIAPMLCTFRDELRRSDYFCHLHSKKSPHFCRSAAWNRALLDGLLGSAERINAILARLSTDAKAVYVDAAKYTEPDPFTGWNADYAPAKALLRRRFPELDIADFPVIDFPHGTMFWGRTAAFHRLWEQNWDYADFPAEPLGLDGTELHALERLMLILASDAPGAALKITS